MREEIDEIIERLVQGVGSPHVKNFPADIRYEMSEQEAKAALAALITTSNKALLQDVREQIPLPEVADMSQHHRDGVNYAADRMKAALDKIAKERGLV